MKGYEVDKGQYIELTAEELEAGAIDIDEFVPENELYLGNPYYIVPDGDMGTQGFAVIREDYAGSFKRKLAS